MFLCFAWFVFCRRDEEILVQRRAMFPLCFFHSSRLTLCCRGHDPVHVVSDGGVDVPSPLFWGGPSLPRVGVLEDKMHSVYCAIFYQSQNCRCHQSANPGLQTGSSRMCKCTCACCDVASPTWQGVGARVMSGTKGYVTCYSGLVNHVIPLRVYLCYFALGSRHRRGKKHMIWLYGWRGRTVDANHHHSQLVSNEVLERERASLTCVLCVMS